MEQPLDQTHRSSATNPESPAISSPRPTPIIAWLKITNGLPPILYKVIVIGSLLFTLTTLLLSTHFIFNPLQDALPSPTPPSTTHNECKLGYCVQIAGSGPNLCSVELDCKATVTATPTPPIREMFPLSTDHDVLAFLRNGELWLFNDHKEQQISSTGGLISDFQWAKDGLSIFYIVLTGVNKIDLANGAVMRYWVKDNQTDTVIEGIAGNEVNAYYESSFYRDSFHINLISLSHSGNKVAYTRGGIWVLDLITNEKEQIHTELLDDALGAEPNLFRIPKASAAFEGSAHNNPRLSGISLWGPTSSDLLWSTDDRFITSGRFIFDTIQKTAERFPIFNPNGEFDRQLGFTSPTEVTFSRRSMKEDYSAYYQFDIALEKTTKDILYLANQEHYSLKSDLFFDQTIIALLVDSWSSDFYFIENDTVTRQYTTPHFQDYDRLLDFNPGTKQIIARITNQGEFDIVLYDLNSRIEYLLLTNGYDANWQPD